MSTSIPMPTTSAADKMVDNIFILVRGLKKLAARLNLGGACGPPSYPAAGAGGNLEKGDDPRRVNEIRGPPSIPADVHNGRETA
jgi:hypothetical protein